jgi:hypothetical protein
VRVVGINDYGKPTMCFFTCDLSSDCGQVG